MVYGHQILQFVFAEIKVLSKYRQWIRKYKNDFVNFFHYAVYFNRTFKTFKEFSATATENVKFWQLSNVKFKLETHISFFYYIITILELLQEK